MISRVVRSLIPASTETERSFYGGYPIVHAGSYVTVTYRPERDEALTGFVIPTSIAFDLLIGVDIVRGDEEPSILLGPVPAACFIERGDCRLTQHRMGERDKYIITFTNMSDAPVRLLVAGLVDQP